MRRHFGNPVGGLAFKNGPTLAELKAALEYDPLTGIFRRRVDLPNQHRAGSIAGCENQGYIRIELNRVRYMAHRLAWLYVHGRWPTLQIDHIDRNRTNNRISNLREVTGKENCANREIYGITAARHRFRARIRVDGKIIHLGHFDTPELARSVFLAAQAHYFGDGRAVPSIDGGNQC